MDFTWERSTGKKKTWHRKGYRSAGENRPNEEILLTCNSTHPLDFFKNPAGRHLFDSSNPNSPLLTLAGLQHLIFFLDHPDAQTGNRAESSLRHSLDPQRGTALLEKLLDSDHEWRHISPLIEDFIANKMQRARLMVRNRITHKSWSDYLRLYEHTLEAGYAFQKRMAPDLLCLDHLTRFREYIKHSTFFGRHGDVFPYYGCSVCASTVNSIRAKHIVAVLDTSMTTPHTVSHNSMHINWLQCKTLFPFTQIEIGTCPEDEITDFCIQVGNDTDTYRTTRYSTVNVYLKPGTTLSSQSQTRLSRFFRIQN